MMYKKERKERNKWNVSPACQPEDWPLVLYRSPECWGYAELEQTWKYKSTQCSISYYPYRSIRNKFDTVIKMVKVNPGSSFEKSPRAWALGTSSGSILKLLLFPSFCTSSRKIPFTSLFYMKKAMLSDFMHIFSWFYTCTQPLGRDGQPIRAKIFMSTGRPHHYGHLLQV